MDVDGSDRDTSPEILSSPGPTGTNGKDGQGSAREREDKLIMAMHNQGLADSVIADHLRNQGLGDYKDTTIRSRYRTMIRKQKTVDEERLEEDFEGWQGGEDDILFHAVTHADAKVLQEVGQIRAKRFQYAAAKLNEMVGTRFTASMCQERFDGIMAGTQPTPADLADDPEARRTEDLLHRETFQERRRIRDALQAKADKELADLHKTVTQDKAEAALAKEQQRLESEQKKEQRRLLVQERLKARERTKINRQKGMDIWRAEVAKKKETKRVDRELLRALRMRQNADNKGGSGRYTAQRRKTPANNQGRVVGNNTGLSNGAGLGSGGMDDIVFDDPTLLADTTLGAQIDVALGQTTNNKDVEAQYIIDNADDDPREIMAKCELLALAIERGMTKNHEKETKSLLARRIRESDLTATLPQIYDWLHRRGLPTHGTRPELLWRLTEYDATRSRSWRPKHMAALDKGRRAVAHSFKNQAEDASAGTANNAVILRGR